MAAITLDGVHKTFGAGKVGVAALQDVNLTIDDKEFVAIVGPSGCGKTTCLRLVAGFEFPTAGSVLVEGRRVTGPGPDRAVVFQQFALFPWKTVFDNIALGLRNKGVAKRRAEQARRRRDQADEPGRIRNRPSRISFPAACSSAWRSHAPMCWIRTCC